MMSKMSDILNTLVHDVGTTCDSCFYSKIYMQLSIYIIIKLIMAS